MPNQYFSVFHIWWYVGTYPYLCSDLLLCLFWTLHFCFRSATEVTSDCVYLLLPRFSMTISPDRFSEFFAYVFHWFPIIKFGNLFGIATIYLSLPSHSIWFDICLIRPNPLPTGTNNLSECMLTLLLVFIFGDLPYGYLIPCAWFRHSKSSPPTSLCNHFPC